MRPIAVGCTLHHLAAKCAGNRVMQAMGALLAPHQLGYGVPLGVEAAVHATHVFLQNLQPGRLILKLDFRNAFNCLRRDKMIKAVGEAGATISSFGSLCIWFTILPLLWREHHPVFRGSATGRPTQAIALLPHHTRYGAATLQRAECLLSG